MGDEHWPGERLYPEEHSKFFTHSVFRFCFQFSLYQFLKQALKHIYIYIYSNYQLTHLVDRCFDLFSKRTQCARNAFFVSAATFEILFESLEKGKKDKKMVKGWNTTRDTQCQCLRNVP